MKSRIETVASVCERKNSDLETRLRALLAAGDMAGAATQVIKGYGAEVLGFLLVTVGDHDDAAEALAQASYDLWSSIRRFHRQASLRTWFYALARHAAARLRRAAHRRPGRRLSIEDVNEPPAREERTRTAPYLRSEIKEAFAVIRAELSQEDRALLVLRVDRRMSWLDVARILVDERDQGAASELARHAARLRKRFQLLKDQIRERARAAGLLQEA